MHVLMHALLRHAGLAHTVVASVPEMGYARNWHSRLTLGLAILSDAVYAYSHPGRELSEHGQTQYDVDTALARCCWARAWIYIR